MPSIARRLERICSVEEPSRYAVVLHQSAPLDLEIIIGRAQIVAFFRRKWDRELDYRLIKELGTFQDNRRKTAKTRVWSESA